MPEEKLEAPVARDEIIEIERRSIQPVPINERHGKSHNQGTLWFAAQISIVTVVIGSLATSLGLGFWDATLTCVVADVLGALITAACVTMGPRMGMPQMILGRAAFGRIGNYLPAVLATLLFVGYYTSTNIVDAEAIRQMWHSAPYDLVAIVLSVIIILITIFGYKMVHFIERYLSILAVLVFAALTISALVHGFGPAKNTTVHGSKLWEAVALEFMVIFSFTASWAPYASDFSRYLPANIPSRRPFVWAFIGLVAGTVWMNVIGVYLGTLDKSAGVLPGISVVTRGWSDVVLITIVIVGTMVCVINAYSGAISGITWDMPLTRVQMIILIGIASIVLSVAFGGPRFNTALSDFLYLVAYFVTPWAAIIIIDFWIAARGGRKYPDIQEFYKRDGVFGLLRARGLVAFLVGVGVSVPFMDTDLFKGPIGQALGGADISYGVSAIVAGAIYWVWSRRSTTPVGSGPVRNVGKDSAAVELATPSSVGSQVPPGL